jgi:diguanylate cyclase (GGDEF)-like protein/PAS domain S-box-containing protein
MRFIDNRPIWVKAFAVSIVLLICLFGIGVKAYFTVERSASGLALLSQVSLAKQREVSGLVYETVTHNSQISRYVTWASNGVNPRLLDTLRIEIIAQLHLLKERLSNLSTRSDLSADEVATISRLGAKWDKYQSSAEDTLDVGASDAAMASLMLEGTNDEFQKVAHDLERLSLLANDQTRAVSHELATTAEWNKRILATAGLISLFICAALAMFVTHSIVTPIRAVTEAMEQVSSRNANVEIGYHDRKDEIGQMVRAIDVFRQNMERQNKLLKEREEELRAQNLRFEAALNNMSQGLCMFDGDQRLIISNKRYAQMYGFTPEQVRPGTTFRQIIEYRVANGVHYPGGFSEDYLRERTAAAPTNSDKIRQLSDGRIVSVSRRLMPNGGWVVTHEDITERRQIEERIAYMAHHDALTDLPNRTLLRERLEMALTGAGRSECRLAVLMLDLDRFKEINDTLGHPAGDALLKAIAQRLTGCVREGDTVARLGGDEFAVVETVTDPATEGAALAERIQEAMSAPFDVNGHQVVMGTSIGIAVFPGDGNDPDQLLKNADLALYRAKGEGRGIYRFFEPEMNERMQERRNLERDLRNALSNEEFELYYQPFVSAEREDVCGFEALLRWHHPERGLVSPAEFIPLAEETGLIVAIGDWVVRQACLQAQSWPEHIKVAVNLSAMQFRGRNLVRMVQDALANAGLLAQRLELEITESVLLQSSEATLDALHELRALGVRIAMDDFGTGYSSLSYLRRFPFDKIKIDQCFIADLSSDMADDALSILRAITTLGACLGMTTTVEGVETKEQVEKLRGEGCTEMQGYYFGRPIPAAEVAMLFQDRRARSASAA